MKSQVDRYNNAFRYDFPSSIALFLIGIPLCMGVALASQAPLFSGLIAGVVGGIVVGLLSRSNLSVSGPAAGLSAVVATAIITLPSYEAFLVSVVIAGVLQLILGFAKAGVAADYVPNAVIKGMITAIGCILILNQVPHLLGDDSHFESDEGIATPGENANIFLSFFNSFKDSTPGAAIIGGVCLLLCFVWERSVSGRKGILHFAPAAVLSVATGILLNFLFSKYWPAYTLSGEHLVIIPIAHSAQEFFSFFSLPDWSQIFNMKVLITGLVLGLVASMESLLSIEAVDDLDPYQRVTPTNRELKAQGVGNIVSGLIGGLPLSSVIVRSSANVNAGAKTKMSTVYNGILLLLCVAFIPSLLNLIPKAAFAAILIFLGYKLARPLIFRSFFNKGWDQFMPFIATVVAILSTDLLTGVLIGLAVGIFYIIRTNLGTSLFVMNDGNKYLFRFRKDVSFLNKPLIKAGLEKVPANSWVLIDVTRADFVDKDVAETIEDFMLHAPLKNITVNIKGDIHSNRKPSEQNAALAPTEAEDEVNLTQ